MKKDEIILTPLIEAKATFDKAMATVDIANDLERDGCIQRFEYCYELAWKTAKRFLVTKGIEVHGSKDTFRESALVGYIDDPERWFNFLEMRNLTVHTYNKDVAQQIFEQLDEFQSELEKLLNKLKEDA